MGSSPSLLFMIITMAAALETLARGSLTSLKYFVVITVFGLLVYIVQNEITRYRSRVKNLPGPRGWPVVGNLFQVCIVMCFTMIDISLPL